MQLDSLKGRVKSVRKKNRLSQVEFAEQLEITQSVVSLMEAGKASVSVDVIRKISEIYRVSCDWLIFGDGRYEKISCANGYIPLINVEAKAGYLKNPGDVKYLDTLDLYRIPGFENGNYRIYDVDGDSMMPTILPRDRVICEEINLDDILDGSICCVVTKKDILLKRVYRSPKKGKLIFKSDNSNFKNLEFAEKDVIEVWLVVSKLTNSFASNTSDQDKRLTDMEAELREIKQSLTTLLMHEEGKLNDKATKEAKERLLRIDKPAAK